ACFRNKKTAVMGGFLSTLSRRSGARSLDPGLRRGEALAKPRALRAERMFPLQKTRRDGRVLVDHFKKVQQPRRWTPACAGVKHWQSLARCARANASLDLGFLVGHVLAHDRIVLLDLHLVGRGLLVLVGGVEMAAAGRGHEADLVALGC